MKHLSLSLALLGLLSLAGLAGATEQWIVVTAPAYQQALEPLCAQRKAQGFQVRRVLTTDVLTARQIRTGEGSRLRERVHQLCREHKGPSFILLVGAVEAGELAQPDQTVVPALRGTISRMKGQPTDNGYGCPEGGRLPTAPVGRLPARSAEEARAMVNKILAFENDRRPGRWKRRLVVLAGIPAYNPVVDRLVESLAFARIERLSPVWTGQAIYTSSSSRFTLPAEMLHRRALEYVEQGEVFTLYLGHSNATGLYGGGAPNHDPLDWSQLQIGRGAGVFLTFGCNGCQLSGPDGEGYGVAAVRNPHGPVAAVGSHGICFAAMVQLAVDSLFEKTFAHRLPERLGDSWLALEQGLAKGKISDFTFRLLDSVDGDSTIPQATQRQEHLEMFVLLGDPALRLPVVAEDIELSALLAVRPGGKLQVVGKLPARLAGSRVRLSLERTVGSVPTDLQDVPRDVSGLGDGRRDRILLANHERANRFVLSTAQCTAKGQRFEAAVEAPAKLPWKRVILRAAAANEDTEALGVQLLPVDSSSLQKRP